MTLAEHLLTEKDYRNLSRLIADEMENDRTIGISVIGELKHLTWDLWTTENYEQIGLLLLSFDRTIRIKARNVLITAHLAFIERFKIDDNLVSVANETLVKSAEMWSVYDHLLKWKVTEDMIMQ